MSAAVGSAPGFRLLGEVKAWRDGEELDLGSAHRRTILAALAMRPNRTVSREELIDAVWGDAPPQSIIVPGRRTRPSPG